MNEHPRTGYHDGVLTDRAAWAVLAILAAVIFGAAAAVLGFLVWIS